MKHPLEIRIFAHSWVSDWNHGNAHFLRGLARELVDMGNHVRCYEKSGGWSVCNLMQEGEEAASAIESFHRSYPELDVRSFDRGGQLGAGLAHDDGFAQFLDDELTGADLVIIHEWNEPELMQAVLARKHRFGFRALFHDTHHRAYSRPEEIARFPLEQFDGVLAFGEVISRIYRERLGVRRAWTFHEAADVRVFKPLQRVIENDLVWIGNWGDEERSEELKEFLIAPAGELTAEHRRVLVHGVRYPREGREALRGAGIEYAGYLPNLCAPEVYARSRLTLHVPRRQYANGLSGVPTIRVFEALACGIPLLCAPWSDSERLFRPGQDYLVARDGKQMRCLLRELLNDDAAREQMARSGLESIRQHHTCRHRAGQLMEICGEIME